MAEFADPIATTSATFETTAALINALAKGHVTTTGGSADAQTAAPGQSIQALTTGTIISIIAGFSAATTTPTLNVNGLGAKTMKRMDLTALRLGDIIAGNHYLLQYDSASSGQWCLFNPTANDGWTQLPTCTRTAATTFTLSGDFTGVLSVGDRFRVLDTTTKYFNITGVSHAAGTTTVTVTGGSDYSLVGALTLPYCSKDESPNGFPDWFNYSPTLTGFSANPTNTLYQFRVNGRTCTTHVSQVTNGTSNATGFTITTPITVRTVTNANYPGNILIAVDNGSVITATAPLVYCASGGTTFILHPSGAFGSWTSSGGKRAYFTIMYQI